MNSPEEPRSRHRPSWTVLFTVSVFGCTSGSDAPTPSVPAVMSVDVAVVTSLESHWATGEGWTVPRIARQTIGVRDGDEAYQFFEISAAARQADGDIVVADAGARTVRLYGPDGGFKKLLGSGGSGPGEFQRPAQILISAEDSIFVWDDVQQRISSFDSAGNLAGVEVFRREGLADVVTPPLYPGSTRLLSNGELLVRLVEKKALSATGHFRQQSGALRVTVDLTVVDTLMLFGDVEQVAVQSPWGALAVVPALARNTSIAIQPNEPRVCIGDQNGPQVVCFEPDGVVTTIRWRERAGEARGIERDVAAWRERTMEEYQQKLSVDDARRIIDRVPTPTVRPEYSELILDLEGNLWVARGPAPMNPSDVDEYLVFDRTGRLLGPVLLPPMRIMEVGLNYIIGVHKDELEVQHLQMFEISRPANARQTN